MKKFICMLLLVLSIIIMLSGLTMSYFHDKSNKVQIPFTTGILKMEINFPENQEDWKPGEENAIPLEWSFKNVGSQPAKLRVKVEGEWDSETLSNAAVKWEMNASDWDKGGDYYIYDETVDENEEVSLGFDVWLDIESIIENYEAYNKAEYNITLTMEAVQKMGSWD